MKNELGQIERTIGALLTHSQADVRHCPVH